MSQFSHLKRKFGNTNWSKNSRSRRRRRKFQKPAGAREESDSHKDNNNNNNIASVTYDEDEDDIVLQQILFYSAQFHSGKKFGSCSDKAAGKKVLEPQYSVIYGSISKVNSIHERGESSCTYCEICDDAKPPNTLKQGSSCWHYYCEECIRNYIAEKIDEDINEVKCPVKNCKRILDVESLMPKDFLVRVEDAIRETEVLASPCVIECPFLDCIGELVDDKKGFLIRACPECWRLFCVNCRASHLGMTCAAYKLMIKKRSNIFNWRIRGYDDDDDDSDGDDDEEEEEEEYKERGNSMFKILPLLGEKAGGGKRRWR